LPPFRVIIVDKSYKGLQNIVAAILTAELIMDSIFMTGERICEAIPENICVGVCGTNPAKIICWMIAAFGMVIQQLFEGLKAGIDLHDGVVDGAEIEATLVNTEKLVNWTCQIEGMISSEFQAVKVSSATDIASIQADGRALQQDIQTDMNTQVAQLQGAIGTAINDMESQLTLMVQDASNGLNQKIDQMTLEFQQGLQMLQDLLATPPSP